MIRRRAASTDSVFPFFGFSFLLDSEFWILDSAFNRLHLSGSCAKLARRKYLLGRDCHSYPSILRRPP